MRATVSESPVSPAEILGSRIPGVAAGIDRVADEVRRLGTTSMLPEVDNATARVVGSSGKRLRSMLTLSSAVALGGTIDDKVITSAACVELVHVGSLVHDDVMDQATQRRGVRTINAESGVGLALMVGDFILARASSAALSVSLPVARELALAVLDLVEGQFRETADLFDIGRGLNNALESVSLKTAALFRTSCVLGGLCAGAPEAEHERMGEYGMRFGVLFQILDDLLDLTSTAERLGKPVGNDLRQGVYTVPLLRMLDSAELSGVRQLLATRGRELNEADIAHVLAAVRESGLIENTLDYCGQLATYTAAALPGIPSEDIAEELRALPQRYVDWARALID